MTEISYDTLCEEGWTVIGDQVFDLGRFRHPGGDEIKRYAGGDATFAFINAHGILGELGKLPRGLRRGVIIEETLPRADRELRQLWRDYRARGLFDYPIKWHVLDVIRMFGLFALVGLSVFLRLPWLATALLVLFATLNVMWWVHDVCHDSVFASRDTAKRWAQAASIVFVGVPVLDYQYSVHRIHHAFTNIIGADQALETGPVVWHERMAARTTPLLRRLQPLLWFFVILPMTFVIFMGGSLHARWLARDWRCLTITALRWVALGATVYFGGFMLAYVVGVCCAAYLLGLFASLNHFHRTLHEEPHANFPKATTDATQNMRHPNRFTSWFVGGLDLHIEHHFFATMPRRSCRSIAPDIRAYCQRNGLDYNVATFFEAVWALWRKLRDPYKPAATPPAENAELSECA